MGKGDRLGSSCLVIYINPHSRSSSQPFRSPVEVHILSAWGGAQLAPGPDCGVDEGNFLAIAACSATQRDVDGGVGLTLEFHDQRSSFLERRTG